MATTLLEIDARECRRELIELFRAGGNEGFEGLFDWYYSENGSRPARTWVLRDRGSGRLVGSYSVVFRDFVHGDRDVHVGVAGNLMVHPDHRSAFAALHLVRAVRSVVEEGNCALLLGLPMQKARTVLRRMGFREIGTLRTYTHLLDATEPLRRRFGAWGSAAAPVVNLIGGLRRGRRQLPDHVSVTEVEAGELEELGLDSWGAPPGVLAPRPNPGLLRWRLADPGKRSRAYALRLGREVQAVVCVTGDTNGRAQIPLATANGAVLSEARAIRTLARFLQGHYSSVSTSPLGESLLARELEGSEFLRRGRGAGGADELLGYWSDDHPLADVFGDPKRWAFLSGLNDV